MSRDKKEIKSRYSTKRIRAIEPGKPITPDPRERCKRKSSGMGEGTAVERRRKFRGCGIPSEVLGRWVRGRRRGESLFSTMCEKEELKETPRGEVEAVKRAIMLSIFIISTYLAFN